MTGCDYTYKHAEIEECNYCELPYEVCMITWPT